MIDPKIEKLINEQIAKEFHAGSLYLSMSAYFFQRNLDGFGDWFLMQAEEEKEHAMKLFRYLIDRGGKVEIGQIDKPQTDFKSALEACEVTLEHERKVTASINNIVKTAHELNDYATSSFLTWYVDEQVEEEAHSERLVDRVKLVGDNSNGILMLDKEMGNRGKESTSSE